MPARRDLVSEAAELRLVLGQLVRRMRSEGTFPIAQLMVLSRLEREGAQTTSALAAADRVRPQSMAQTLSELEIDGLISRRPDLEDRRQVLIDLTDAGRGKLAEVRGLREGWLSGAIGRELDADEQKLLLQALPLLRRLAEG